MNKYKIIHTGTLVTVDTFDTYQDARTWLDSYGVSASYKAINYKIVELECIQVRGVRCYQ